jgi:hypothetical protein
MMFTLRTHIAISGALLAALIGTAILGSLAQRAGLGPPTGIARYVAMALYFALFVAFGLSAVPVVVKLVLSAQTRAGNQDVAAVAAAVRHQNTIIWWLWGLILAGAVIAVPAAIFGGLLGDGPRRALDSASAAHHLGVLAAKPGMTLDQVVAQSTVKIDLRYASAAISGGREGAFDFTIPGTTLTFPGSRYYYITTFDDDHTRIRAVNVGTSPAKMPIPVIDSADAALCARLAADGWLAGHEVYRTEEDQRLHGGLTEGPEGRHWLKDGVVLSISRNRMDDARPDEDPATAGEWIQYIDLWTAADYPGFDRFVFQPPRGTERPRQ